MNETLLTWVGWGSFAAMLGLMIYGLLVLPLRNAWRKARGKSGRKGQR